MIAWALAAAIQTSPSVIGTNARTTAPARYLRVTLNVNAYGIPGTGTMTIDRRTGRYVQRYAAGPVSFAQGFDGTRAWDADPTGMPAVQGNVTQRGTVLVWGYVFAFPRPAQTTGSTIRFDGV
ncbi:MAG: hypothetical protein JO199_03295, partial [Candidatus Eremiobacteraeota bacterium]|nr:hypothetical protein [Candidatus Eremiobacteraeota bacterium]